MNIEKINLIHLEPVQWTEIQGFSSKGRRVKSWYERVIDGEVFLYKEPKKYASTNFVTKEIWTELLAYKIGTFLGLDIPEAIPATDGEHYGILIKSFLKRGEAGMPVIELAEASDILSASELKLSHNLLMIKRVFFHEAMEAGMWKKYLEMLIFDCLIGNNDRHDENWGLLYGATIKKLRLAPIYDNASCLTSGETEEKVEQLLKNEKTLIQFINNSKPPNLYLTPYDDKHYKHFEIMEYLIKQEPDMRSLIEKMLKKDYLGYTKNVLIQIQQMDVPEIYKLSDTRCKVIIRILEKRKEKLKDLLDEYS